MSCPPSAASCSGPQDPDFRAAGRSRLHGLRAKHPVLHYRAHHWKREAHSLVIDYLFELEPDIKFTPRLEIKGEFFESVEQMGEREFEQFVFHLGLIELPSYWKAACPPAIHIAAGALSQAQRDWWRNLLREGLSEFYYVNGLHPDDAPVDIHSPDCAHAEQLPAAEPKSLSPALVPIGGGKDSVVTLEFLRRQGVPLSCFVLNDIPSADSVIRAAGSPRTLRASRSIDPQLLALNRAGYLNGHTPFSAYLAFLSAFVARLDGCQFVLLSNERSADEPNTGAFGFEVNHQFSKSFAFERGFGEYLRQYISTAVSYCSLLRPLYELQIAELFARDARYLTVFKSCNRGIAREEWCGACPKCLFAFTMMAPFVQREDLVAAFGGDLFEREELVPTMRELVGLAPVKPLECVGTRAESLAALFLAAPAWCSAGRMAPVIEVIARECPLSTAELRRSTAEILTGWNNEHRIPEPWAVALRNQVSASAAGVAIPAAWGQR